MKEPGYWAGDGPPSGPGITEPPVAPWGVLAMLQLKLLARSGRRFTSEDVTGAVGQPPSSGAVGAILNSASQQGWIARVGYTKAARANQHSAMISEWQGNPALVPPDDVVTGRYRMPRGSGQQLGFWDIDSDVGDDESP